MTPEKQAEVFTLLRINANLAVVRGLGLPFRDSDAPKILQPKRCALNKVRDKK